MLGQKCAVTLLVFLTRCSLSFAADTAVAPATPPNSRRDVVAISSPKPEYPYEARNRHITGSGIVALTIDVNTGQVTDAAMAESIGNPILDNSAVSAFRRWRFEPGTAERKMYVPIAFTMTGASYGVATPELKKKLDQPIQSKTSAEPDRLNQAFAILKRTYPTANPKWMAHPPADSAWIFSAFNTLIGTVEVGFQGDQVVYMVFRRGVGGLGWKRQDIDALHAVYCKELLRETKYGETYTAGIAPPINAAIITRKDFDAKALF